MVPFVTNSRGQDGFGLIADIGSSFDREGTVGVRRVNKTFLSACDARIICKTSFLNA